VSIDRQVPGRGASRPGWQPGTLLAGLPGQARDQLLGRCRSKTFSPGQYLLRQGDHGRHAIVLLEGLVKIRIVDPTGFSAVMALRRRGDIVGEFGALTGEPRTASAIAATPVLGGVIGGRELSLLAETHPSMLREIIRLQGRRLEWANQRRVEFAARPARWKIARMLAELALEAVDEGSAIHLSQYELASLVGVALNTVEEALRHLAELDLVVRRYRSIVVPDPARLHAFAESVQ
jgi:CRP-like cAMP-binding protein